MLDISGYRADKREELVELAEETDRARSRSPASRSRWTR